MPIVTTVQAIGELEARNFRGGIGLNTWDTVEFNKGGARIMGVMLTMDDKEGVEAIKLIRPETVIPIHYNDYGVFKSPLEDFKRAAEEAGLSEKIVYLAHGETYNFEVPASRREKNL